MCIRDSGKTVEEIAEAIGADKLIYQDLDDLVAAVQENNPEINDFDCSCFNEKGLCK